MVRQGHPGPLMPSPFQFKKYGQSGMDVSELFPNIGGHVDDIAFVRSVYGQSNDHVQAHLRDADRADPHGFPERRLVGDLRAGVGEREPAGFRRDSRRARRPARRRQRLERPGSCPRPIRGRCSARPAIRSST